MNSDPFFIFINILRLYAIQLQLRFVSHLIIHHCSKDDGKRQPRPGRLVADDHGSVGSDPGVGQGAEDTDQGLQYRGQEDTRPQSGHWPAPMVTRVIRWWPAGGQHTEAGHGEEADRGEEGGGEADRGHVKPAEAQPRGLGAEDGHEADGVEEAGGEAEQGDAHCGAGEKEGAEQPVLVPGPRGQEDDEGLHQEEAEAGQVEDVQRGHSR